jgi:hypothetical protein
LLIVSVQVVLHALAQVQSVAAADGMHGGYICLLAWLVAVLLWASDMEFAVGSRMSFKGRLQKLSAAKGRGLQLHAGIFVCPQSSL